MGIFVPLHVHTEYSLLDGAIKIGPLMEKAKKEGMTAVAITDHGALYGVIDFYKQAVSAGIKPIIGCEFYLTPDGISIKTTKMNHLILLAENRQGYDNLARLTTIAYQRGFYRKPRIDMELLRQFNGGLIALSACIKGQIPDLILQEKTIEADIVARQYLEVFGEGNFFLEIQKNGMADQDRVNEALLDMGQRFSIPLIATNDCHYLEKEDAYAHQILLCIQTGKKISDPDRLRFPTDQFYFKTQKEMIDAFTDFPGAIENTTLIAGRCNLELDFKSFHFPKVVDATGLSSKELLRQKANAGFGSIKTNIDLQAYRTRLDYELDVICRMGFADYFLIVADFIEYAKTNNIPVGPGRGSAAGSLVSYVMNITAIDPLEHGLIFERFLNPQRASMPDIDVDFCKSRREQILTYIKGKYGSDRVSPVISFGKMNARGVIRDVGRVLDLPKKDIDQIAKLVPDEQDITLQEVIDRNPSLQQPEIKEFLDICKTLETLLRNKSKHASAIVIADKPLIEYLPMATVDNENLTQFDMYSVESIGLVKFDILGLNNLTVIDMCLAKIACQNKPVPDLTKIDMTDNDTYELLSTGNTVGVFQSDKSGIQDLFRAVKPTCFSDIVSLMALNRPGPLGAGMGKAFIERKHDRKQVKYLLPELEPILTETYGVILYQEQVMRIAVDLAGYSMAEADGLRKAMGKKKADMMAEHRLLFLAGCVKKGLDEQKAAQIYDQIEKFGGYGFNKSHSAAYALIVLQTAYLKAHYPVEFMVAWLTCLNGDTDKISLYIGECRKMGIPVLPPDVNYSGKEFMIENGRIRYSLLGIKKVGEKAVNEIVRVRREKPFSFLSDFSKRTTKSIVNSLNIRQLINSGAFDSLGTPRQRLLAELGTKQPADSNEIETFGFYLTDNPLSRKQPLLDALGCIGAKKFMTIRGGASVRIAGTIMRVFDIITKKGQDMCFVDIECLDGIINAVMFPNDYIFHRIRLKLSAPLFFKGKVQYRDERNQLILNDVMAIDEAEFKHATSVLIRVKGLSSSERLLEILKNNSGDKQGIDYRPKRNYSIK